MTPFVSSWNTPKRTPSRRDSSLFEGIRRYVTKVKTRPIPIASAMSSVGAPSKMSGTNQFQIVLRTKPFHRYSGTDATIAMTKAMPTPSSDELGLELVFALIAKLSPSSLAGMPLAERACVFYPHKMR